MMSKQDLALSLQAYLTNIFQEELAKVKPKSKGHNLYKSIATDVQQTLFGDVVATVEADFYAYYVNSGRKKNLKGVPIYALLRWFEEYNITLRGKSARSSAFAMQNSIKAKGIKKAPFIDNAAARIEKNKTLDNMIEKYVNDLIEQHFTTL